ncbi:hypothetical protein PO591_20780 [Escherichia coli]|uniref:hypothetical protein n=1 Tax=Escherichia coli TaxID=562 RepID=UPI00259C704B|nr:hypothetical protein [Escherichia coli]MDM4819888.1 hypothetical protein [Escherichia coli]MDM4847746.1 hypothetical protein [Escherichia coli]HBB3243408.1 hypothetical protein [Escherichia coli]HBB3254627.1 hypothetical protein [Escherichia coli]HBB3359171.1 hypothetical protein [Escherichia coli]
MYTLVLVIGLYFNSNGVTSQKIPDYKSYDECQSAVPKAKRGESITIFGYCIPQPADKTKT